MLVPALILLALVLAVGLVAVVSYLRYAHSPAAVWKRGVRAAVAEQEARLRAARRGLAAAAGADVGRLREEYLALQLRGLGVEELAKYPGIGPVTVARLREAGLTNVADCARARLTAVAGIGPSRQADLKDALRKVRREAESRFDAGASKEAVAFADELKRRDADREGRRLAAEQSARGARAALDYVREPDRIARQVTWLGYLFGHRPAELTEELMRRPLKPPAAPIEEKLTSASVLTSAPASGGEGSGATGVSAPGVENERPGTASLGPPHSRPLSPPSGGRGENTAAVTHASGALSPPAGDSLLDRLRVVARFGLAVAKADGRIAAAERRQVRAFLARRYAPTPDLVEQIDPVLSEVEGDLPTLGDAIWDIRRATPASVWPELYQFAVSVADASGADRNAREAECLARIAEELSIGPVSPPAMAAPAPEVPSASLDVPLAEADRRAALDIDAGVPLSVDLIRRQYRLLMERFAGEKFSSHGPEFVRMAAEKRERAEQAARQLLAGYNEPLEPSKAEAPADLRYNPDLDAVFGA